MSQTSQALGMPIPQPHVDTWNESMGMVTEALEAIDAFAGDTATIESSPSTAAHSAGEFLLYGGRLYKVTAPIAVGASLTLGTNVEAAKVGSYLTELSGEVDSLEASMAPVESVTATSNHAIGDYFMLGNVLMKATQAIAAGETINASKATPATVQSQIDTLRDSVSCYSVSSSVEKVNFSLFNNNFNLIYTLEDGTMQRLRMGNSAISYEVAPPGSGWQVIWSK